MRAIEDKQHAHELIDRLDPSMMITAVRFLEFIALNPIAEPIATVPVDDEPLTEEEDQALDRAEAWLKKTMAKAFRTKRFWPSLASARKTSHLSRWRFKSSGLKRPALISGALDRSTAMRIFEGIHRYALTGEGDVKTLEGKHAGKLRLRLGNYRVFLPFRR